MPATHAREIAVVSECHTRTSRERLALEEANGPYFSRLLLLTLRCDSQMES